MAKTISNKKYEEFWNNDDLSIKSEEKTDNKSIDNKDDIKKQVKKEVKKEVKKLEEQVKELSEKIISSESIEDQPKPKKVRKPKIQQNVEIDSSVEDKVELIQDISVNSLIVNEKPIIEDKVELIQDININPLILVEEPVIENNKLIEESLFIQEKIQEIEQPITNKELYEKYTLDDEPYKIFFRGNLIFNSINHKEKPIFLEDGFILFGKKYIYRGIRFEKY